MRHALIPAAALLLGLANPASAAPGFATGSVNLRAGPGTTYPKVVVVPSGAGVEIFGCLEGYSWCDVGFGSVRGWVSSNYLQYTYEARRVPLPRYAPQSGVPIVTFSFGDYWRDNYRGRSWYTERDRWGGPPPPRAAYGRAPGPGPDWRPDWREGRPGGPGPRGDWRDDRPGRPADWRDDRGGPRDDRGPGGRDFERRGPEGRGPEGRGFEGRGPEGRGPEGRGPGGRGPDDRGPPGRPD
ncbi:SH3 domain-containing protein [Pararoseomonas indoligenes]|uniref:SH3 domain-containing protein n=1 Tax=Roseomonas indoligenes TaxID=2820811 RepID=A0A940N1G0_9PROT|nr:SH3 domain-containing protein [Pararoseomonas indoligenes]MBP0493490.1 SH3 domain-containing protein [Pararoseomonas indoligenes]